ncbi:LysR family transcriptional regulator [Peribacillus sp. S4]|uniref:LysR family transcriptional regulator n=1 Tax=Peribacillus sp. S4 TaxID=3384451 RepID=UPI00398A156D
MEIHQLHYVVEVAKHQHFTRAAEEICVSQSTLSQQITKLEGELQVKLFNRTTRVVRPTSAGHEFILYAKRILSEIERAKQCMQEYVGLSRGKVKIGAINSIGDTNLPSLIVSFQKIYPGLNLSIVEEGSYKLLEMLETSEIDLAILTPPLDRNIKDVIDTYPLIDDELVLIMAKDHHLANKEKCDLKDVASEKFIFPSRNHSAFNVAFEACRDAGFEPEIVCESSHLYARFSFVSQGMGVALVSSKVVNSSIKNSISVIRLTKAIKKPTVVALLKHPHHSPPVIAFRDFVLNSVHI